MPGALYVIVYVLPDTPLMPAPEKIATPLDIVAVAVPTMLAPRLTVIVTTEEESAAMLPLESIKFTRGCVVNAAPLAAPAAEVANLKPEGTMVLVVVTDPVVKVNV